MYCSKTGHLVTQSIKVFAVVHTLRSVHVLYCKMCRFCIDFFFHYNHCGSLLLLAFGILINARAHIISHININRLRYPRKQLIDNESSRIDFARKINYLIPYHPTHFTLSYDRRYNFEINCITVKLRPTTSSKVSLSNFSKAVITVFYFIKICFYYVTFHY